MRLIKGKGIIERIAEAVSDARRDGETVEKVELTEREWTQLCRAIARIKKDFALYGPIDPSAHLIHPCGIIRPAMAANRRFYLDDTPIEPEDRR